MGRGKHGTAMGTEGWDALDGLTTEAVVARAREIDVLRVRLGPDGAEDPLPAWWRSFHGRDEALLWGTPFEWLAGLLAAAHGVVAFDRLERTVLPTPASWIPEDLDGGVGAVIYRVSRGAERLEAHPLWPFALDAPLADYSGAGAAKWWSHGLVHTLIGAEPRVDVTEWEVMAEARLSEAVAAVHWYCLAELGRLGDGDLPLDLTDLRGEEAGRYAHLARRSLDPRIRAARLGEATAGHIAENALALLRYERFAWHAAMTGGRLLEPGGTYLGLGEAGDYARVHTARLRSEALARWRAFCLRGPDAVSRDPEARAGAVIAELLVAPLDALVARAEADGPARRFRRVLQDLGARLCQAEAFEGPRNDRHTLALARIAEALDGDLRAVRPMEAALDEVAAAVVAGCEGAPLSAADIFAQGCPPLHRPGSEPRLMRYARRDARIRRGRAWHPVLGRALAATPSAVDRSLDTPQPRTWLLAVVEAAELEARAGRVTWEAYGYLGWMLAAAALWTEGAATSAAERWLERVARRTLPPDPTTWGRFELVWNPHLQRIPMPFDATWDEAFARGPEPAEAPARFKPRAAHAIWYALVGAGRTGPVYLPLTPRWAALIARLKRVARLDEVASESGFDPGFLAEALAADAVLLVERPRLDLPERVIDVLELAMQAAASVEQRREPEGPWNEPEMAAAYAEFCDRYGLYRDTSEALCEVAEVAAEARVAELGFGTGETTRAILRRLGPAGRVFAVDPALHLFDGIMQRVTDPRARFIPGSARALLHVAVTDCHFDNVIANSTLVLIEDLADALAHCHAMLRPGGRLAFSLQAELLGDTDHLTRPEQLEAVMALEAAREALGIGRPEALAAGPGQALGSHGALTDMLARCGFTGVRLVRYVRPWRAEEYFAWLDLPVVRRGMVAAADAARAAELIARARAGVPEGLALETAWWLVTAERPLGPEEVEA